MDELIFHFNRDLMFDMIHDLKINLEQYMSIEFRRRKSFVVSTHRLMLLFVSSLSIHLLSLTSNMRLSSYIAIVISFSFSKPKSDYARALHESANQRETMRRQTSCHQWQCQDISIEQHRFQFDISLR
jgi:hypothetical protein